MPIYRISRGWLHVDNIEVTAENEEQAYDMAEAAGEEAWQPCPVGDVNYQIESVKD